MKQEVDSNKARGLETETFRGESPAIILVSACLSLDNVVQYRTDVVGEITTSIMARLSWNPKVMLKVLKEALKTLKKTVNRMPEELVMVLKTFAEATPNDHAIMPSVFFLRFICPALAQPKQGGLDKMPEEVAMSLLQTAKALQLVANRAEPTEGMFSYPVAKVRDPSCDC